MVALTLRATKGSALTHNEVDANFTALNTEVGGITTDLSSTSSGKGGFMVGFKAAAAAATASQVINFTWTPIYGWE